MTDQHRRLHIVLGLGLASLAGVFFSGAVSAANRIEGSPHDFSTEGWSPEQQICVACHTPHNADLTVTNAPLWNHELTTKTFVTYSSPTLDSDVGQPTGSSVLCLSCHDGTVAVDSFGGLTGSPGDGTEFMDLPQAVGKDELNNDHPISFTYDAALADKDGSLFNPDDKEAVIGSGDREKTGSISEVMLESQQLQCSSCHDVHNNFVNGHPLLKVTKARSEICLTCHDK